MRNRLLLCATALLLSSCIKRVAPTPGDDRTALAGVPLSFGQPGEVPKESAVSWDFGDGTPPAEGQQVTHAFGKAGVYTIVETIQDKDGKRRSARTHVAAMRRPVTMAVPGDVRAALLMPTPWAKVDLHRALANKLSLGTFFDEVSRSLSDGAGFDVLDPKAAEANGFDPDKGVAFFTLPQDPEALVFVVGTVDDAKSLAAARKLLSSGRGMGRSSTGPFQLADAKLPDGTPVVTGQNAAGDKIALLQRYGYLYLRTAGASDPLASLRSAAALPPDKGLGADPGFVLATRHTGNGDAFFYSRTNDTGAGRYSSELGSSAFAIIEKPEVLQFRIFSQLRSLYGDQLVAAFKPLQEPPDLAAKLPSGASAYLRLSAAPDALWRELSRTSGADAARLRDRVQESTGLDLEKDLIPSFAGNLGIAVYLDATSLIEAIMGEEVGSFDKSAFVAVAQLAHPDIVQAALDRAMKSRPAGDRAQLAGATVFRLGEGAQAAIKEGMFYLAIGGTPPAEPQPSARKGRRKPPPKKALTLEDLGLLGRVLQPQEKAMTLSQEFKRIGIAGFQVSGQENLWVNIAGVVRSIERAGSEHGGMVSAGARLFAERAADLRDALFEARPGRDGIDADLWVRFLPKKPAAAR